MDSIILYPDMTTLLYNLRVRMTDILSGKLEGLYLYGSLVSGDFDRNVSDIDLLAVTTEPVSENELDHLREMHARFAAEKPEWDNRIEVQYASRSSLKTFRTARSRIVNISPGEPIHFIDAGMDWLMNWYFVREYGVTLFGPEPGEFIGPISKEEFVAAAREQAVEYYGTWADRPLTRKAQSYVILTMCRALFTIEHREQASKKRAARWFAQRFPPWSELIDKAFEWRAASEDVSMGHAATMPETSRFIEFVLSEIEDS